MLNPLAGDKDVVTVEIIAACNSLDAVIPVIYEVRKRVKQVEEELGSMVTFKGAYTEDAQNSMYVYSMAFMAELYNEVFRDGLLNETGVGV